MEAIPSLISRQTALTDYQMPHRVQLRPKIGIFLLEGCHIKEKHIRHRGGDTLEGFVEVSAPSSLSSSSYDVKISFEGTIRTWLGSEVNSQSDTYVRTGEVKFLREVQHVKAEQHIFESAEHGNRCRIRFRFSIPEQLISARSNVSSEFLNLAPSIKSGRAFTGNVPIRTYMQLQIMYMINADLVNRNGNVVSAFCHDELEVEVMPSAEASPPLQLVHYPSEFRTHSQTLLRRHLWCRSAGTLHISSWEPEAINLAVSAPRATTLAFVKITLIPHQNFAALLRPYEWEITAKTWLKARTFCSTKVSGKIPIIPFLKADPFLQMDTETTECERRKCCSLGWRLDRLSIRGTIESEERLAPWTTFLRIPVSSPKYLVPTFLTALAARRYSLCLLLSITGISHRSLYLEVPVQVIYDDAPSDGKVKAVEHIKEQGDEEELVEMLAPLTVQDIRHSPGKLPEYSYFY